MTDQELIIDALEQAQSILAECIEPGARRRPEFAINQLLRVLDRRNLALAQERLKARCGLRESNKSHRYSNGYDPHPNSWMGNGGQLW